MGEEEEEQQGGSSAVDVKFRIFDGSDLGPFGYSAASMVSALKQRVVSDWPKGKTIIPRAVHEVKLICCGKILENNKTVAQCLLLHGEVVAEGALVMHVVVQPSLAKIPTDISGEEMLLSRSLHLVWMAEKKIDDSPGKGMCSSCSIL